jgi:hypothetical protein
MNTYRHKFYSLCPNNGKLIEYAFELVTNKMIQVEEIVKGCAVHKMGYHEAIADDLLKVFGGAQTLKAHHHGVDIETSRSERKLDQRVVIGPRVFEKGVALSTLIEYLTA